MTPSDAVTVVAADERTPDDSPTVLVDVERWRQLAGDALLAEGVSGELTLTFIDSADMAELNAEHMGVPGPTDVLSFPLDDDPTPGVPTLLGDIVIAPAVAAAQFVDHAGTIDDEIALLVVHGVLHIRGHDHADSDEALVMRARELELLESLHWQGPAPEGFRQIHD